MDIFRVNRLRMRVKRMCKYGKNICKHVVTKETPEKVLFFGGEWIKSGGGVIYLCEFSGEDVVEAFAGCKNPYNIRCARYEEKED